jgi:methionine-rich copper-binding protein CopC
MLTALMLLPALAGPAVAHALLMGSTPAPNTTVPPGHLDLVLHYNSRIDAARSRVTLVRSGERSPEVLAVQAGEAPDQLRAGADLQPGAYVLRWQVLAMDGHITRGEVPFTVAAH